MAKFHGKGNPPKKKFKISFKPTLNKNNAGNVVHPSILNNVGVIRAKIRRKK